MHTLPDGQRGPEEEAVDGAEAAPSLVPVWDIAVRLFHWGLVAGVTTAWLTGGSGHRSHEIAGFAVAGLVAFRIVWGFAGTTHALFTDFVRSPSTTSRYLREVLHQRAPRHLGHNPAGGMMIVVLLLLLLVISVSGYMQITTAYFGVPWVENLHHFSANMLIAMIPLHVLGVVVSSWMHQENLVSAMITGNKAAEGRLPRDMAIAEWRLMQRVRASEGMTMLLLLVGASAGYGVYATSGRGAVSPNEQTPVAIVAPTPEAVASSSPISQIALVAEAQAASTAVPSGSSAAASTGTSTGTRRIPGQERQDHVGNHGPDIASRAWLLSSGGRLYDRWYAALGTAPPTSTHPSWPADNKNVAGPETWRCKTCHGWDYQGREGQYGRGPLASGAPGLLRARDRTVEDIVLILGGDKHRYTDEMLPQDAKLRLALFLREGLHTTGNHFNKDGSIKGKAQQGKPIFENVCASCHGFDGRQRKLGASVDPRYEGPPLFVGTKVESNPVEVLHKIRNGHPGAIMVSLRPFPMELAVNVLAYARTLPSR